MSPPAVVVVIVIAALSTVTHSGSTCPQWPNSAADELVISVRKDGSGQFRTVRDGRSIYRNSTIESVATETGVITAHARDNENGTGGYVFMGCNITGTGRILLGRAYRPCSRVVFALTYMGSIIDPQGWSDFGYPKNDKTVFFAEYENWGPGADMSVRVNFTKKLSSDEASPFLTIDYIDGKSWLPRLLLP